MLRRMLCCPGEMCCWTTSNPRDDFSCSHFMTSYTNRRRGRSFPAWQPKAQEPKFPLPKPQCTERGDLSSPCPSSSHSTCGQGFPTALANAQEGWGQGDLQEPALLWDLISSPAAPFAMAPLEAALGQLSCSGCPGRVSLPWPLPAAPALLCSMTVVAWLHLPADCTRKALEKGFSTLFPPLLRPSSVGWKNHTRFCWHIVCFEKTRGARLQEIS